MAAQVVREYLLPMIGDQSKPQDRGTLKSQFLLTDQLQSKISDLEAQIQTLNESLDEAKFSKNQSDHSNLALRRQLAQSKLYAKTQHT